MKIVLYSILNLSLSLLATASATETPKKSSKGAVPDSEKTHVNHLRAGNERHYSRKAGNPWDLWVSVLLSNGLHCEFTTSLNIRTYHVSFLFHLFQCDQCKSDNRLCPTSSGATPTSCEAAGCCFNIGKYRMLQRCYDVPSCSNVLLWNYITTF